MSVRRGILPQLLVFLATGLVKFLSYIVFPDPRSGSATRSSLSRPDMEERARGITVTDLSLNASLELVKENDRWNIKVGPKLYPVRRGRVETLFAELTKKREMRSYAGWASRRPDVGGAFSIRVTDSGGVIVSDLTFYPADATGLWLTFTSGMDRRRFEIDNAVSSWLSVATADWADLSPFADIESKAALQRVSARSETRSGVWQAGRDPDFPSLVSALTNLACKDITNLDHICTVTLSLETGDLEEFQIGIARLDADDWIVDDGRTGASYVVSDQARRRFAATFGQDLFPENVAPR